MNSNLRESDAGLYSATLPLLSEINSTTDAEISTLSKLFHSDGHTEWDYNGLGCMFIYLGYDIQQTGSSCSQHGLCT